MVTQRRACHSKWFSPEVKALLELIEGEKYGDGKTLSEPDVKFVITTGLGLSSRSRLGGPPFFSTFRASPLLALSPNERDRRFSTALVLTFSLISALSKFQLPATLSNHIKPHFLVQTFARLDLLETLMRALEFGSHACPHVS